MIKAIKSASSAISAIFEGVEEYALAFKGTGAAVRSLIDVETTKLIAEAESTTPPKAEE